MKTKEIPAPTPGRIVLVLVDDQDVPAVVLRRAGDTSVTVRLLDRDKTAIEPAVQYGERSGGGPAPGRWCYPPHSNATITVPAE